jgi:hypothetical protein
MRATRRREEALWNGKTDNKQDTLLVAGSSNLKQDSNHFHGVLPGIKLFLTNYVHKSFKVSSHTLFIQHLATTPSGQSVTFTPSTS